MSCQFAGPEPSQQTTTGACGRPKCRELRDKFESMLYPEKPFYNNDLRLAEGVGFEPTVRSRVQRFSRPPRSTAPAPLRMGLNDRSSHPLAARGGDRRVGCKSEAPASSYAFRNPASTQAVV